MGYIRHHAIVVTSFAKEKLAAAHEYATTIFGHVSNIVESPVNGYFSFFIAPDGSKYGWEESNIGDNSRKTFIEYLNNQAYGDGSNSINFAELFYGDDEGQAGIVNHN